MMNTDTLGRVRQIMADLFAIPVSEIRFDSSPDTIEAWDSLQHLNLVLALEQELGVQFTPEEIQQLTSLERIGSTLRVKLGNSGKAF
jgi:acyl carrier protein